MVDHGLVKKKGHFREIDLGYFDEVFWLCFGYHFFVVRWRRIEASSKVMMWCHFWMIFVYYAKKYIFISFMHELTFWVKV
jgi:hypothetical protein